MHFGLNYEINYQLDPIEYLFVYCQLDMFRAYTPIFRSNGCYNLFTYTAYGVLIGFGGLEVACRPLVPKFAGSNPAEAFAFFRAKKSSVRLPSDGK